ncbi:MAG: hypothetical protein GY769_02210 [bacterium]|nr:hypothetical protein [bacterium]
MRHKTLLASLLIATCFVVLSAPPAEAQTKPFTITGVNYTKWLWGTQRFDGSLYNFTSIPGEGFGDNGQGTELELLVSAKPSKKIEVEGRMKARFNQNQWTNGGGFGGGGAGDPGSGDCVGGDCGEFDSRSAQYVKYRGLKIIITPGYKWVDTVAIGSNDWGMFDPFTVGKIRYIDRDNNSGLLFQGSNEERTVSYDFARISLNRLVYGPDFNTGDYPVQDATYALQLKFNPNPKFDAVFHYNEVNDHEIDRARLDEDGNLIGDLDVDDGLDLADRFTNEVFGLRLGFHPNPTVDVRAAFYSADAESDPDFGAPEDFFGISGFSPVPAGKLSDESYKLNVDVNDPFNNGLSFNLEYFDIGADYVAITAARREADVLLTEGHDGTWAWPGPDNCSFCVFNQGNRRIGYGGWQGNAQQVATINVDNEFTDFDEPMAETVVGWKGFTIAPQWSSGDLDLSGEFTDIDYNTNWQAWGDDSRPILSALYPNHESDAGIGSHRNAYAPFQEKSTEILVLKGKYFANVGNGLELFGKIKYIDETDKRMNDARYLPFAPGDCPGGGVDCAGNRNFFGVDVEGNSLSSADLYGNPPVITVNGVTGYQWKPFDNLADDDRDMDYTLYQVGAAYQLTSELWGSIKLEMYDVDLQDGNTAFQAYQLHELASGKHNKDKIIIEFKYNIGGAEMGLNYEYNTGDFTPDFGSGYVAQFADEGVQDTFGYRVGTPGFRGRFGGWNSLQKRDFEQQRLKAFLKLFF